MSIHVVMITSTKQKEEYIDKLKVDNPDVKIVILGKGDDDSDEAGMFLTALFSAFQNHQSSPIFRVNFENVHRDHEEEEDENTQDDHAKRQAKQKTRIVRNENKRSLICNKGTSPFQHKKNFVRSKKTNLFDKKL